MKNNLYRKDRNLIFGLFGNSNKIKNFIKNNIALSTSVGLLGATTFSRNKKLKKLKDKFAKLESQSINSNEAISRTKNGVR